MGTTNETIDLGQPNCSSLVMIRGRTVSEEAVEKASSSSSAISFSSLKNGILAMKAIPPSTTSTKAAIVR
ncbi:hypothetical protein D3C86_1967060 [compost metagenome]